MSLDETESPTEALDDARGRIANLESALARSRTVGMALGILVERRKVTTDDAFALLRKMSIDRGRPIEDVAAEIVAGSDV